MAWLDLFRRPRPRIGDVAGLSSFIDEQAAFLVQKGIYEYARARAGHYAKVLFAERAFIEAVERARWQAYPLGLIMVGEMVEGLLRPRAGEDRHAVLDGLVATVLAAFDRYPVPAALGANAWEAARDDVARRLRGVSLHPPKPAKDVAEPFAQAYFDLMPIHEKLRSRDFLTTRNYLKVTLCNIHEQLTQRLDVASLVAALRQ